MQYTAQQLGSSLGVALAGSIVLTGLASVYLGQIADDPRIQPETVAAVEVAVSSGSSFVPSTDVQAAATEAGLDDAEVAGLVETYESSQLRALKAGLLTMVGVAGLAFLVTGNLPSARPSGDGNPTPEPAAAGLSRVSRPRARRCQATTTDGEAMTTNPKDANRGWGSSSI